MEVVEYRRIPEFPNYFVSNIGNVFSLKRGKFLKTESFHDRYSMAKLWSSGKWKVFLVHRLVAKLFLGDSNLQVNHKDGNRRNNRASNLEWVTASENVKHAYKTGLFENGARKLTQKEVNLIKKDSRIQRLIASDFDVSRSCINHIKNGRSWKK